MNYQQLLEIFLRTRGYTLVRELKGGLNSVVVLVKDHKQDYIVVKFGFNRQQINEIRTNIQAYEKLREIGLTDHMPKVLEYGLAEYGFLVLSYLGDNFQTQICSTDEPQKLYETFLAGLIEIYQTTKIASPEEAMGSVMRIYELIIDLYQNHIAPYYDDSLQHLAKVYALKTKIESLTLPFACFSNWDFTPDDTYLVGETVMFSDPHIEILGVPIIELACFSGLLPLISAKDPEKGQMLFESYAISQIAPLLEISADDAQFIFRLARLFQIFMSIRYRRESDPQRSTALFGNSMQILAGIC